MVEQHQCNLEQVFLRVIGFALKILSGPDYHVAHNLTGLYDSDNLRLDPPTKFA